MMQTSDHRSYPVFIHGVPGIEDSNYLASLILEFDLFDLKIYDRIRDANLSFVFSGGMQY